MLVPDCLRHRTPVSDGIATAMGAGSTHSVLFALVLVLGSSISMAAQSGGLRAVERLSFAPAARQLLNSTDPDSDGSGDDDGACAGAAHQRRRALTPRAAAAGMVVIGIIVAYVGTLCAAGGMVMQKLAHNRIDEGKSTVRPALRGRRPPALTQRRADRSAQ